MRYLKITLLMLGLLTSRSLANEMRKASEAAAMALMPQIEITSSNKSSFNEYIRRIDENTWNTRKKDSKFVADLNVTFKSIPFGLNSESKYTDFREATRQYLERIKHVEDKRESFQVFRQFLTDTQVIEYHRTLRAIYNRGGWRIYERSVTPQTVVLEIMWLNPLGFNDTPEFTATVLGGHVLGAPEGQLFKSDYKLQHGFQTVQIARESGKDLSVSLNAAGRSASHSVLSDNTLSLSAASPVGTVIMSMLPPHRYSDVTNDSSNWYPKTSKWVPADGRSVAGSKYASLISTNVPDLRGMFLRGLNSFEPSRVRSDGKQDPQKNRIAGGYQGDAIAKHKHQVTYRKGRENSSNGGGHNHEVTDGSRNEIVTSSDNIGAATETRPVNIAVYYYIRIN